MHCNLIHACVKFFSWVFVVYSLIYECKKRRWTLFLCYTDKSLWLFYFSFYSLIFVRFYYYLYFFFSCLKFYFWMNEILYILFEIKYLKWNLRITFLAMLKFSLLSWKQLATNFFSASNMRHVFHLVQFFLKYNLQRVIDICFEIMCSDYNLNYWHFSFLFGISL